VCGVVDFMGMSLPKGVPGFECQTGGRGGGGGPQALKKIYYSNEKLVKWLSISLSVALQLFQCALHSLQTHF